MPAFELLHMPEGQEVVKNARHQTVKHTDMCKQIRRKICLIFMKQLSIRPTASSDIDVARKGERAGASESIEAQGARTFPVCLSLTRLN